MDTNPAPPEITKDVKAVILAAAGWEEGFVALFQKKMEPRCVYCARGKMLDQEQVVCPKKGVMAAGSSCRAFRYDPLRRVPPRPLQANFSALKDEDFTL